MLLKVTQLRKNLSLNFLFLLGAFCTFAQNGTINGNVKDETGASLSGASVTVQRSGRGATTNANGEYTISLTPGTYNVTASYVGYTAQSKEVTVQSSSTSTVDFVLQAGGDVAEVVVTGTRALPERS